MKIFNFYKLLDVQAIYLYIPTITDYVLIHAKYQFIILKEPE